MPRSSLQKYGAAQECSRQAISDPDGRAGLGAGSSLLAVAGVVRCPLPGWSQAGTRRPRLIATMPKANLTRRVLRIGQG